MQTRHDPGGPATVAASPRPSRRRVLLAWEMGEGLGHASRLLTVARGLRAEGWAPVVAAREPRALKEAYAAADIPVIAAPAHRSCFTGPGRFQAATFADVMGVAGYADRRQLAAVVGAWDDVLTAHAPEVVIADYAPLLSLAAYGRCPLIAIGDGFVTPPAQPDGTFPPLDPAASPVWPPADLLDAARAVQAARGLPQPESLPEILAGLGQVVSVPPEIDIHHATRPTPAAGPWMRPPPPLDTPGRPQVFAYLRTAEPLARMVLQVLVEARVPGGCYLPDATEATVGTLARAGITVHRTPPPLRQVLAEASFFIHHGGIGSMEDAALAGRPQLLLPRHREQFLNTRRAIEALPGTVALGRAATLEALRQRLPPLLRDMRPLRAAHALALRLTARRETAWDALARLLARVA